jgi:uracil-DNA glycosylase
MSAQEFLPSKHTIAALKSAAKTCRGCELYKRATQTVFGEGTAAGGLMLVGEQPGDQEDLEGRPFVGPAGRLLDEALQEAGIDRERTWVTNAVKHFKWEPRGKRRLHKKPSARELTACRPWLDAEIEAIRPEVIVCLGATAAQELFGRSFRITKQHGQWQQIDACEACMATWHPSAVLRVPDSAGRQQMRGELVADLTAAVERLAS